jgi:DNA-binding transcriptional regulator YiaG
MPSRLETTTPQRAAHLRRQGKAIATARHAAGLSQPAAAILLDVSLSTFRSWEHGIRMSPAEARRRMVEEWGGDPKRLGPEADACRCCGQKMVANFD